MLITLAEFARKYGSEAVNIPSRWVGIIPPTESYAEVYSQVGHCLTAGAVVVLFVDATENNVSVYRPTTVPQVFAATDTLALPGVLPGFAVPVARFFE
jgi:Uma2 family endonuclease